MKGKTGFSFKARVRSFGYAWQGIRTLIVNEHNARIHLFATLCVVVLGLLLQLSSLEWAVVALCIGGVFMAEALNSAVEALCDKVSPEYDPLIGRAKDLAAGAVLLFVIGAVVAGLCVFVPKLLTLL
ncbi:MAG: diacylglycerol kinase family protein [Muribaculaceae bacterium]|nr:diacylglycerol kinase family protein [Muribaculaceae bacterium]